MFGKKGSRSSFKGLEKTDRESSVKELALKALDTSVEEDWPAERNNLSDPVKKSPAKTVETSNRATTSFEQDKNYYNIRNVVFSTLIDTINLGQLSEIAPETARNEIRDIIDDIISARNFVMSIAQQEELFRDICNDVLGYGPLELLLAEDNISDIMINGPEEVYVDVNGKMQKRDVRFRDNQHLLNICQKIVGQVGRRIDESSPVCDARLADGSRVNVVTNPVSIDGTILTIRKFRKEKLTLDELVRLGSISSAGAEILKIIGRVRCNVIVSGGTGSGKTTLLNCLTNYVDLQERIITCEDAAELQLQQPHVVRLETRPLNIEGKGEITMRDLVINCLRMRPERIIVGEVRGNEVMDLLQAMNTGHDGSMGTIHANSPRECLNRIETMIAMGGFRLSQKTVREIIVGSVDIVIQVMRLRDGSRRITHITEVTGMEGDVIITQDLLLYKMEGEDAEGNIVGRHFGTGIHRPHFWERVRYYGEVDRLTRAIESMEIV